MSLQPKVRIHDSTFFFLLSFYILYKQNSMSIAVRVPDAHLIGKNQHKCAQYLFFSLSSSLSTTHHHHHHHQCIPSYPQPPSPPPPLHQPQPASSTPSLLRILRSFTPAFSTVFRIAFLTPLFISLSTAPFTTASTIPFPCLSIHSPNADRNDASNRSSSENEPGAGVDLDAVDLARVLGLSVLSVLEVEFLRAAWTFRVGVVEDEYRARSISVRFFSGS